MAQVAAFDEYARDCWISGEADSAAHEAAAGVASRACARHCLLQASGEAVAIDAPVIRLGATAVGRAAVVVNADQYGGARAICASDPFVEVNEGVV